MTTLVCFGLGYSARHYLDAFGDRYDRVIGTTRRPGQRAGGQAGWRLEPVWFDGRAGSEPIAAALDAAHALLVCIPPTEAGDPALERFSDSIARAPRLEQIVYLSTVGVYGDHGGAWVDETTEPTPRSPRSKMRFAAEAAWQSLARRAAKSVAILRLAGIYGPQRNPLVDLQQGKAARIVKPGQVFNRIHVADLAQAIDAVICRHRHGVFNVADDEPAPPQDVIEFAAGLLGREPPPQTSFAQAQPFMSPMALSFYGENKRVRNTKLKAELGVRLRYPSYREGLRALHEAGDHRCR